MTLRLANVECPHCHGRDPGSVYENTDEVTHEKFLIYKCFSAKCHGRKATKLKTMIPEEYYAEITGEAMPEERQTVAAPKQATQGLLYTGHPADLKDNAHPWGNRGLNADVCEYFGVMYAPDCPATQNRDQLAKLAASGEAQQGAGVIFPYYDDAGNMIAQKVRTAVNKKGSWYKADDNAIKRVGFFGQQLWKSNAIRDIIITFGEFDALAVYQMLGQPVVSISNGDTSAPAQFRAQYNWLQRFNNIILVPDNDDSCRAIIPLLGAIFPRKIKVVNLTHFKDPNDYLKANAREKFIGEFYAAQPFTPEKIISLASLEHLLYEDPPKPIASYPWEGLNNFTGGVWAGELIAVKAPPKVGKTTFFTEIASHLYNTTTKPIGLIYLEETQRDLVFRFVSIALNKNLQRLPILESTDKKDIAEAASRFVNDDRIFVIDHWGSCSSDFLEEKIKEFVLAKGCQFIFFDHISMAIADESNKDERLALDRLVYSIKALTVGIPDEESYYDDAGELKTRVVNRQPTIFTITHVNDNGQPRGSRVILQASNLVISLERDKLATDPAVKNLTKVIIEDNRRYGETGVACTLSYDANTGRLTEVPVEVEMEDAY